MRSAFDSGAYVTTIRLARSGSYVYIPVWESQFVVVFTLQNGRKGWHLPGLAPDELRKNSPILSGNAIHHIKHRTAQQAREQKDEDAPVGRYMLNNCEKRANVVAVAHVLNRMEKFHQQTGCNTSHYSDNYECYIKARRMEAQLKVWLKRPFSEISRLVTHFDSDAVPLLQDVRVIDALHLVGMQAKSGRIRKIIHLVTPQNHFASNLLVVIAATKFIRLSLRSRRFCLGK